MTFASALFIATVCITAITAIPHNAPQHHATSHHAASNKSTPRVDLGYAIYEGVANASTRLNTFKGIRFAAPPTGSLRWQAPQLPSSGTETVTAATTFGAVCPHSLRSGQENRPLPSFISEDCLFLNIYAPQNASGLPVLVHIHGGGYGVGDGREDLSNLINSNDNSFIAVSIQYRLGAFGFLAGDEVYRKGVVNAGLLDQNFALQWVQSHIDAVGGNPRNVTIYGISAGGGSVMLHDIAFGGTLGTSLFTNSISASPYLPQQYGYKDWIPSQAYYAFATQAGCPPQWAYGNRNGSTIFDCLVSKDTVTLQQASTNVSASGLYGTWAFLPVTDGFFVQTSPSKALLSGRLNGLNHLSSNVVEESFNFVPQNINSENDLSEWVSTTFPLFNLGEISELLDQYPLDTLKISARAQSIATSDIATGHQQRANLIYGESTFICSSYWLAEAYSSSHGNGYKMQFSAPIALHAYDGIAVFGNIHLPNHGPELVSAMQSIIGNFVRTGNPSSPNTPIGLNEWPAYMAPGFAMANLNQKGGVEVPVNSTLDPKLNALNATWRIGPGLQNDFEIVNGYDWDEGRGKRCDFWRSVAESVPM